MAERPVGGVGRVAAAGRRTARRTRRAVATAYSRRDSRTVIALVGGGYLLAYLYAVGDLGPGDGSWGLTVVADPLARAFETRGPFRFEPIARLGAGPVNLLVAPLSLLVAAGLATLVGVNLSLSYLAVRRPAACGLSPAGGALAAVPGLLSGAACCGPTVLLVVGIQASALLVSAFSVLVPLSALALVVSLVVVGRRVAPVEPSAVD